MPDPCSGSKNTWFPCSKTTSTGPGRVAQLIGALFRIPKGCGPGHVGTVWTGLLQTPLGLRVTSSETPQPSCSQSLHTATYLHTLFVSSLAGTVSSCQHTEPKSLSVLAYCCCNKSPPLTWWHKKTTSLSLPVMEVRSST